MFDRNNAVACFFFGLGVGIAAGVLAAPRSGRESRQRVADCVHDMGDQVAARVGQGREFVASRAHEMRERTKALVDEGVGVLAQQRDRITAAVEAGRKAYQA